MSNAEATRAPRIYGNESKCRAAVARYIARAEELLDQAQGVKKRLAAEDNSIWGSMLEYPWVEDFRRWFRNAYRGLQPYLQDQLEDVLPLLSIGLPPDTGKPRHHIGLDNGEPWLREVRDELVEFQGLLGVRRNVGEVAPIPARFAELRASGLIEDKVVSDLEKDMLNPRTARQLSNAIGSAKELTEATLRASLDRLGQTYSKSDDLGTLMRKWRVAVADKASPDDGGKDALDKAMSALGNLVRFLSEWRNPYGRGHGRPQYPLGLKPRHARLAIDAAETSIRFIVTTLDDLEMLPPTDGGATMSNKN